MGLTPQLVAFGMLAILAAAEFLWHLAERGKQDQNAPARASPSREAGVELTSADRSTVHASSSAGCGLYELAESHSGNNSSVGSPAANAAELKTSIGLQLRQLLMKYVPTAISIYLFTINGFAATVFTFLDCEEVYVAGQLQTFVQKYPAISCSSVVYTNWLPGIWFLLTLELIILPLLLLAMLAYGRFIVAAKAPSADPRRNAVDLESESGDRQAARFWANDRRHWFSNAFLITYRCYKNSFWWWEVYVIIRRLLLVAVVVFCPDIRLRYALATLLCVIYLVLQLLFRPLREYARETVYLEGSKRDNDSAAVHAARKGSKSVSARGVLSDEAFEMSKTGNKSSSPLIVYRHPSYANAVEAWSLGMLGLLSIILSTRDYPISDQEHLFGNVYLLVTLLLLVTWAVVVKLRNVDNRVCSHRCSMCWYSCCKWCWRQPWCARCATRCPDWLRPAPAKNARSFSVRRPPSSVSRPPSGRLHHSAALTDAQLSAHPKPRVADHQNHDVSWEPGHSGIISAKDLQELQRKDPEP